MFSRIMMVVALTVSLVSAQLSIFPLYDYMKNGTIVPVEAWIALAVCVLTTAVFVFLVLQTVGQISESAEGE